MEDGRWGGKKERRKAGKEGGNEAERTKEEGKEGGSEAGQRKEKRVGPSNEAEE